MWPYIVIMIATLILSYALRPKPEQPNPQTLSDVNIPTVEEGKPIAVAFGDVWVDDSNIVWYGDLRTQAIKSKGKK